MCVVPRAGSRPESSNGILGMADKKQSCRCSPRMHQPCPRLIVSLAATRGGRSMARELVRHRWSVSSMRKFSLPRCCAAASD